MNYVIRYKTVDDDYRYIANYFNPGNEPIYNFTGSIIDAVFYTDRKYARKIVKEINDFHKKKYGFGQIEPLKVLAV